MQKILDVQNASRVFGTGENTVRALKGVSFSVEQGEFTGIMGPSGCGKSTLLGVIATIDTVSDGCVLLGGKNMADLSEAGLADFRRDHLGFVFQDYNLLDTLTMRENIALALVIQGVEKHAVDDAIDPVTNRLGIGDILDKFPYEVSGGQRQRCACARAVVTGPQLILADEPTGALDSGSAQSLMETFERMNQELGVSILMVTHDAFSACYCSRILFMRDGRLVSELPRRGMEHKDFALRILAEQAEISGGSGYVC